MIFDNPNHTFVIAEAGSNWKSGSYEDDIQRARLLIDVASEKGADAIKFQTYKSETVFVPEAGQIGYLKEKGIVKSINEIFDQHSMPYEMIPELQNYCNKKKIQFMSTPFSISDAKAIDPFVEIHKIASFEINHLRLLEFLAKTKKPILISTGASSYDEIDFAVKTVQNAGNDNIGLLQCTSKYPAPLDSLNLSVIPHLKSRYNLPVGFSDHSIEASIGPLLAIGYGATFIEKHFTLDRNLPGPDHQFALIPNELEQMIDFIRKADQAKGTGKKTIQEIEKELHKAGTRSIQAIQDIKKGDVLHEGVNFEILRPGMRSRGLEARHLIEVEGKKATKDILLGEGISEYE